MDSEPVRAGVTDRIDDLAVWRQRVASAFAPAEIDTADEGFSARIRTFEQDGLRLSRMGTTGHVLERTGRHLVPHGTASFLLCLQLTGEGMVIQDGKTAGLKPGDMAIVDLSLPHTLVAARNFTCLGAVIPGDNFPLLPVAMRSLIAVRMEAADPVTAVVATGFRNFERSMAMLPALARRRMTHNVIDLFETLCLHHGTRLGAMKSDPRGERLDVVLRFIDEHLADPDLDPEMVARAHFMSVRALHKLAHESGTSIAGWIRHRRLENCKADLANPAWRSMSVAAIGARWGLTRASHFTTLFRAEYGMTPSAYRQSCL